MCVVGAYVCRVDVCVGCVFGVCVCRVGCVCGVCVCRVCVVCVGVYLVTAMLLFSTASPFAILVRYLFPAELAEHFTEPHEHQTPAPFDSLLCRR